MRKLSFIATFCALLLMAGSANGQHGDVAFGFGTLIAPSASSATGSYSPQSLGSGLYPSFSADFVVPKFLMLHNVGLQGEMSWRASRNVYEGYEPFRPIFYDFNGIWAPRIGKKIGVEVMAGIGAESSRFYTGQYTCSFVTCTDYVSSNHFLGHVGGGVKYYFHGNFFIRPEAHFYLIRNNNEFSSAEATRVGASIGYSF